MMDGSLDTEKDMVPQTLTENIRPTFKHWIKNAPRTLEQWGQRPDWYLECVDCRECMTEGCEHHLPAVIKSKLMDGSNG